MRVLILSWEYPPLIEGGLARHVRKLAENLVCQDVDGVVRNHDVGGFRLIVNPPSRRVWGY